MGQLRYLKKREVWDKGHDQVRMMKQDRQKVIQDYMNPNLVLITQGGYKQVG